MKIRVVTSQEFNPFLLLISAEVRYWEDATVNGVKDTDGTLIPLRIGDLWCPRIDIESGVIRNWPIGTTADVHYKVCDAGLYWLQDSDGKLLMYNSYYVPSFLDLTGNGFGDYLIFDIDGAGKIAGWKTPEFDPKQWEESQ